jgi:3-oxoacyl-[acyl-carrier-protein] synthase II
MSTPSAVVTGVGLAVPGLRVPGDLLDPPSDDPRGFDPAVELSARSMRHKDRASRLALYAVGPALHDAGLIGDSPSGVNNQLDAVLGRRTAVVVSTNLANLEKTCEFTDIIHREAVTGLSPATMPHTSNMTACWVAIEYGLRGPNITLCNGTTSGLDAVFWARNLIAVRRAEIAVVIGVEPDTPPVARLHREDGAGVWLDGAVALIVESAQHARQRAATPRAVIGGYGRAADHVSAVAKTRADLPLVDLYLVAEHTHSGGLAAEDSTSNHAPSADLTTRFGRCSGALGVLQCVAGVARLDRGDATAILAIAGSATNNQGNEADSSGVAALLLERPAPAHQGSPG